METFSAPGEVLTFTAPSGSPGGVVSGTPVLIGSLLVIPSQDADGGDSFEGVAKGIFRGVKVATEAWTEGLKVYWDDTAKKFTSVQGSSPANVLVGVASKAVAAAIGLAVSTASPGLIASDATITVESYTGVADGTVTVTLARQDADPEVHVLTEGVDFTAETDEATTATNLAAAISAIYGLVGTYTQVAGSPPTETVVVTASNPVKGDVRLDGAAR